MTGPPTSKHGWCFACGRAADLRLIRTQPNVRARKWKCQACIDRSAAFAVARRKADLQPK